MKSYRTNRSQAEIRRHRLRVIRRKRRLAARLRFVAKHEGGLAKGKIHCSCRLCCAKTRQLGFPKSQLTRIADCKLQLLERAHQAEAAY